jgi:uncharacterized protein
MATVTWRRAQAVDISEPAEIVRDVFDGRNVTPLVTAESCPGTRWVRHVAAVGRQPTGGVIMKRALVVAGLALGSLGLAHRAPQPYRVVFDLTSRDSLDQKAVLRWVREVSAASPKAEEIEVVMYGKGFELVMPERSAVIAEVQEAMKNPKVSFAVCEIAMRNNRIERSQLLPGVRTVPDGIHELVSRQQEHWGYIKVMH